MSARKFNENLLYNLIVRRPITTTKIAIGTLAAVTFELPIGKMIRLKPDAECRLKFYIENPLEDDDGMRLSVDETERVFGDQTYQVDAIATTEDGNLDVSFYSFEEPAEPTE